MDSFGPDTLTRMLSLRGNCLVASHAKKISRGVNPVLWLRNHPCAAGQRLLELGCGVGRCVRSVWARVVSAVTCRSRDQPAYARARTLKRSYIQVRR